MNHLNEKKCLTHIDKMTQQPQMVDVSEKKITKRSATARCVLFLDTLVMSNLTGGRGPQMELISSKGPVFATAIIAGTLGVKKTPELIPFCHALPIENIKFTIKPLDDLRIEIICLVQTNSKTGVEMEALTGVHVAALTIHDMCKSLNPHIKVEEIKVVEKSGGKSDLQQNSKIFSTPKLRGLILAGGKSQRMGMDKALINYHQHPDPKNQGEKINQVQFLKEVFKKLGIESFLSLSRSRSSHLESQDLFSDDEIIWDVENSRGPIGGIIAAMNKFPDSAWFVVACDLPFINETHFQKLLSQRDPSKQVTCYFETIEKRFEPLFSIYEPSLKSKINSHIKEGFHCPQKLLQDEFLEGLLKKIDVSSENLRDGDYFLFNANTPLEKKYASDKLKKIPIKLKYFAHLRELSQKDEEDYFVTENKINLATIYNEMKEKYHFKYDENVMKYAVNDDFVNQHIILKEGDQLIFIPPVAGG
jgi:cyclic pyranopterin phosphate synthase